MFFLLFKSMQLFSPDADRPDDPGSGCPLGAGECIKANQKRH